MSMDQFYDRRIIYQNESITYEEAYVLNGTRVVSTEDIIEIIANVLTEIIEQTDKQTIQYVTNFHGKNVPSISIKEYLARIARCSHCSQECFIFALIYVDRITERHQNFIINSYNIHRLLITSIMLATKFFDDRYYNNEYYAKVGGIGNQEINLLERDFLQLINFRLYIAPILFFRYRERLLESYNFEPMQN
ncbi:amine-terminal domain cyclin (macronuclear) [Tetrahymena thermophila SB210]|uniref:Cyclin n=1 Tax=Tetrahymena thermophila (strain SB210) TaxID=312017 RepID=Q245G5_TETTS|nr:amine-terminal domain cyclin [Tetrahymena thermophila SB210]EAS03399.2 amine-terminal domain cyclin [Tetrahymena thermophila SB210]|eukprot:XP_001023644.2 amine-terminal domain cyclin [Tetrahymena thermophila SB210]